MKGTKLIIMYMKFKLDLYNTEIYDLSGDSEFLGTANIDKIVEKVIDCLFEKSETELVDKGGISFILENSKYNVFYKIDGGLHDILIVDGDINFTESSKMMSEDILTGLPTKFNLLKDLEIVINSERRDNYVLYLMDIDSFRKINDLIGMSNGDLLLKKLVDRVLYNQLSNFTLYRYDGDSFALLREVNNEDKFIKYLDKLLEDSFIIDERKFFLSLSKGSVNIGDVSPNDTIKNILDKANAALLYSKERGKGMWTVFSEFIMQNTLREMEIESLIREALKEKQFTLAYQPQISFKEKKLVGAEALIRWIHPEKGFISPSEFIPIAEKTGLVVQIGEWVVEEVCRQQRQWLDDGLDCVKVGVNIGSMHFKKQSFIEDIKEALIRHKLNPKYLGLEITEGSVIEDAEDMVKKLARLKSMKIHVSIDDFGTGYSSLSYLKKFKIDTLKIDQSFVMNMSKIKEDKEIVKAIVALAKNLNIKVIAEGVETEDIVDLLMDMDCTDMQGYLFSKPVYKDEFRDMLSGHHPISNLHKSGTL